MITIKEIAKIAGVSKSTVSKALNGKKDISPKTREKILKIAKAHNFTPNAYAKGLRKRVTENIGVIFRREERSISGNPFYSRVLEGIEEATLNTDYNLLLHLASFEGGELPSIVKKKQVDGILLIGTHHRQLIKNLKESHIPMVLIDPGEITEDCFQVLIDNSHGAYLATEHLIKTGHRRIGFVSGDIRRASFRERLIGFRNAHSHYQIPIDESLIQKGEMGQGYELTRRLLSIEHPPTAIVASHDLNAIQGYQAAFDHGFKIPEDISFVGFDDIDLSRMVSPTLSTIRVLKKQLGSTAFKVLEQIINGEARESFTTVISVEFIERDSVSGKSAG